MLVCFIGFNATSVPIAPLSVDRLIYDSDYVAVLKINAVSETGRGVVRIGEREIPAARRSAQCTMLRPIKGSLPVALTVDFFVAFEGIGYRGITANTTRIVFLKKTKNSFGFTNPHYPSLPASNAETSLKSTVETELSEVAKSESYSVGDRVTAIEALRTMQIAGVTETLKYVFATARPDPVRLTAAQALLIRNDVTPLPEVTGVLMGKRPVEVPTYMVRNLSAAIETGLRNEAAIPELEKLVVSPEADVSRAAATALRNTASKKAMIGLVRALSSPNLETRYFGVIGLGEINADTEWRPIWEDFASKPDKYVDHWRSWAAENRIANTLHPRPDITHSSTQLELKSPPHRRAFLALR
jgi:HEAT repeat protein